MERYVLQPSTKEQGWWVVTDTEKGLVCRFKEHEFNDTQKFTFLDDVPKTEAVHIAAVANGITQYLLAEHPELVAPKLLDSLIDRAVETVKAWVAENKSQPLGTPEDVLERLLQEDDDFFAHFVAFCDERGMCDGKETVVDVDHPDVVVLLDAIDKAQTSDLIANRRRIGAQVAEARRAAGLSVRALAERSGVSYQNIAKIEAGRYNVSIDILSKIATALGKEIKLV